MCFLPVKQGKKTSSFGAAETNSGGTKLSGQRGFDPVAVNERRWRFSNEAVRKGAYGTAFLCGER